MEEVPHLVEMHDTHHQTLTIIMITDSPVDVAQSFVDEHSIPFPVLTEATDVLDAYGVDMIWGNANYLIDSQGQVFSQDMDDIEEKLTTLDSPGESVP